MKTFGCTHFISKCVYLSIYNMRHITHKILAQKCIPPVSAVIHCTSSLRVHMSCYRIFLHEQFQKHIIGIPGLNQSFDTNVCVLYIFCLHLCMRNIGRKYTNVVLLRTYFDVTLYSFEKVCTLYCTN